MEPVKEPNDAPRPAPVQDITPPPKEAPVVATQPAASSAQPVVPKPATPTKKAAGPKGPGVAVLVALAIFVVLVGVAFYAYSQSK